MKNYTITRSEGICLVSMTGVPKGLSFASFALGVISGRGVNIDMISGSPQVGGKHTFSFTVKDDDLDKVLSAIADIRNDYPDVKSTVSGGNVKLLISGELMKTSAGVASAVFKTLNEISCDTTLITTSEIDISLLIPAASAETAFDALCAD